MDKGVYNNRLVVIVTTQSHTIVMHFVDEWRRCSFKPWQHHYYLLTIQYEHSWHKTQGTIIISLIRQLSKRNRDN